MNEDAQKSTNTNDKKTRDYLNPETKKFKKGNPGGGRPHGSVSIVEGIKQKLLEIEPANKKTYLEMFIQKLFLKAIKDGDVALMRDMINRVDGMPIQKINADINQINVNIRDAGDQPKHTTTAKAEAGTESE